MKIEPFASYDRAVAFATAAHEGQFRNDGITPYITHPLAVARSLFFVPTYVKIAAVLHDVIEDTPTTYQDLRNAGFDERTIDIVRIVTRQPGRRYSYYIDAIATSGNLYAVQVKIADIKHNASTDDRTSMKKRYTDALAVLEPVNFLLSNS